MLAKNLAAICIAAILAACGNKADNDKKIQDQAATADEQAKLTDDCRTSATEKQNEYNKLAKAGEYWAASLVIRQCAELLKDDNLRKMVANAEIKSYSQDIEDEQKSAFNRLHSLSMLTNSYPEAAAKYENLRATLEAKSEINTLENERAARNIRDYRTPAIGTTDQYVRESGWGEPAKINRSIDSSGVSEQWVYPNGKYLYFVNGKLKTIQEW